MPIQQLIPLLLSTLLLLAGCVWLRQAPDTAALWKARLQQAAFHNLLLVVLLQFWCNGLHLNNLPLAMAGALLHVIPLGLCLLLARHRPEPARWLLAYSTYGGGNRGVLAVLLLAPQLLADFLVLDLGIFLSLLLCYPVAVRLFDTRQQHQMLQLASFRPALQSLALILAGMLLHAISPDALQPDRLFVLAKYSLLILVSLYLGLSLNLRVQQPGRELLALLATRSLGVAGTLLIAWLLFPPPSLHALLPLTALYFCLPASSLAPQLTPEPQLRDWMAQRVAISSLLYLLLLGLAMAGRLLI